jgi:hypothetical protein
MIKVFWKYKNYVDLAYIYNHDKNINIKNFKIYIIPNTCIHGVTEDEKKFKSLFKKCDISAYENTHEIQYMKDSILNANSIACFYSHVMITHNNLDFDDIKKLSHVYRKYAEISYVNNRIMNLMILNETYNIL